jgi:hypothetical protein
VAFSRLEHLRLEGRAVSMAVSTVAKEEVETVMLDAALERKTVWAWFALPLCGA